MKMLRKIIKCLVTLAMIIGYVSIDVRAIENNDLQNVALNKTTLASNGNSSRAVDGAVSYTHLVSNVYVSKLIK